MLSKKCYHSSSESWHMICRRNPPIPRLAPWYFSTIIVPNYRLLSTDILPVSALRLIHSALWVLASGFNLSRSSSFICICRHITHHHWTISPVQVKAVVTCRPQFYTTMAYHPKPMSICISLLYFLPMGSLPSICATRYSLIYIFHIFLVEFWLPCLQAPRRIIFLLQI